MLILVDGFFQYPTHIAIIPIDPHTKRQGLDFDRDYPFDTEVIDKFNDYACDIHFTGVDLFVWPDHPTFTEVEFEAPE